MPDQLPKSVQQQRSRELAAVEAELRDAYYRSLVGRRLRVLIESREEGAARERQGTRKADEAAHGAGRWTGTACRYATVEVAAGDGLEGQFADVLAAATSAERILGEAARKE